MALLLAGSLLLVILGVGVGLFLRHATPGIDRSIVETLARHRSAETVVWMKRVSILGSTVILLPLVALVAVSLFMRHQSSDAMLLLTVALGTLAVHNAVKALVNRPRPAMAAFHAVGASFPSGHTAQAVAVYGALAYLLQKRTDHASLRRGIFAAAVLLAGAIGFSRIWLGVHYPSDVLGGAALGGAGLFFAVMLFRRRDPAWTRASSES
jgi:undecaprenyl-diphosphatase